MSSVYKPDNFSGRVAYAKQCLKRSLKPGRSWPQGRAFDTCFEMWDGDAVVTALVRKAQHDPDLKRAIARGWSATAPELPPGWLETAAKYADVTDRGLGKVAAKIRAEREKQYPE